MPNGDKNKPSPQLGGPMFSPGVNQQALENWYDNPNIGKPAPTMWGRLKQVAGPAAEDMFRSFTGVPKTTRIVPLGESLRRLGTEAEWNSILDDVWDYMTNPFPGVEETLPEARKALAESGATVNRLGIPSFPKDMKFHDKLALTVQYLAPAIPFAGSELSRAAVSARQGNMPALTGNLIRAGFQGEMMPELEPFELGRMARIDPLEVAENVSDLGEYITPPPSTVQGPPIRLTPEEMRLIHGSSLIGSQQAPGGLQKPIQWPAGALAQMHQPVTDPSKPVPTDQLLQILQQLQQSSAGSSVAPIPSDRLSQMGNYGVPIR